MKSLINIQSDDDFNFGPGIQFPLVIEGGVEEIREWIWNNYSKLYVANSAERQKDHIKLHRGNNMAFIERELEKMYAATYKQIPKSREGHDEYFRCFGNWSFGYMTL